MGTDDPRQGEVKSDAAKQFIASMTMTFEMWHDGLGYNLDLLKQMSDAESDDIVRMLIDHKPRDWRDIEALGYLGTQTAMEEVRRALSSGDPAVRRTARDYLPEKVDPGERERLLIQTIQSARPFSNLSEACDDAEEFHPPAVIDALFKACLNGDGEAAVNFAGLLCFLHGKAKSAFDWDQRPFYLQFNTRDRAARKAAFVELCQRCGVDAGVYGA